MAHVLPVTEPAQTRVRMSAPRKKKSQRAFSQQTHHSVWMGRVESGAADGFHSGVKITRIINAPVKRKVCRICSMRVRYGNHFHKSLLLKQPSSLGPCPVSLCPRSGVDGLASLPGCPTTNDPVAGKKKTLGAKLSSNSTQFALCSTFNRHYHQAASYKCIYSSYLKLIYNCMLNVNLKSLILFM